LPCWSKVFSAKVIIANISVDAMNAVGNSGNVTVQNHLISLFM